MTGDDYRKVRAVTVVGIDACPKGWAAVVLREGEPRVGVHFLPTIDVISAAVPDVDVIAIDIPIGLPMSGARPADLAARAMVGTRRSSVFMTPVRAALEAPTYREAVTVSIELTGVGISQQAYALRAKILEVAQWLPSAPCRVFEVHPEVSFTVMRGTPATASKKTWHGMSERLAALRAAGIMLDDIDPVAGSMIGADDVVDAAAAAWTGRRVALGVARCLPSQPDAPSATDGAAVWA